MEIIVEIGTDEQKEIIKKEIKLIENVIDTLNLSHPIKQIIMPEDFDRKVSELRNTDNYKSLRGCNLVLGINVIKEDGIYLVFSKLLYTNKFDGIARYQYYIHELVHACNKDIFPCILNISPSKKTYLTNLYTLFDEYCANRKSFKLVDKIFQQSTPEYKRRIRADLNGFIKPLIDDSRYYQKIRHEISTFRLRDSTVDQFLENIAPFFDEASKAIVYSYSYIDHYPRLKRFEPCLLKSKFVNDKTISLIEFYRTKYEDNSPDLLDGITLIENFMENFGMRITDTQDGREYCHVLDI